MDEASDRRRKGNGPRTGGGISVRADVQRRALFFSFFFPPADGSAERQSEGNRILMKNERSGNFIPGREKKEEHVKVKCTHGFAFSPLVCGEAGCCPLPAT